MSTNLTQLSEREKLIIETRLEVLEEVRLKVDDICKGEITEEYYIDELDREMKKLRNKLNLQNPAPAPSPKPAAPKYGPRDRVRYNGATYTVMEVDHHRCEYKLKSDSGVIDYVSWLSVL